MNAFLHRMIKRGLSRFSHATWAGLASTSVWQIANYLIPLVTFPYLARVLGVTGFGVLGIGAAVAGFALLLTDWGFALSGTQAVAQARNDPASVSRILWAVVLAKAFLGLLSSAVIIIGAWFFIRDPALKAVLIISTLNVAGSIFGVDWALRGMEEFSKFATASITGRLAAVPLVFLLVHRSSQVAEAAFATAAGGLITAAITLVMARRVGILCKPTVSFRDAAAQIRGGAHLFLMTATISLYTNCLAIVLGITAGTQQVGLFSGGNKIRTTVQGVLSPLTMVSYPRMSYLAKMDPDRAHRLSLQIFYVQGGVAFLLSAGLCATAPFAVRVLLGTGFANTIIVLQILSWLIFIIGLSNVLGIMIMLPFGLKREASYSVLVGAITGMGFVIPLSYWAGAMGTAIAAVTAEAMVTLSMYIFVKRRLSWFSILARQQIYSELD